jgi:hypothetical protein
MPPVIPKPLIFSRKERKAREEIWVGESWLAQWSVVAGSDVRLNRSKYMVNRFKQANDQFVRVNERAKKSNET